MCRGDTVGCICERSLLRASCVSCLPRQSTSPSSAVAKLFQSTLFSTGSDEISVRCYQDDAQTQQEMRYNRIVNLTFRVWIASDDAAAVAAKGFRFRHAASNSFDLDCWAGGWVSNNPGGNSWRQPFKTWWNVHHVPPSLLIFRRQPRIAQAYTFDPLANLTAAQAPLVLGGQQQLWTEQPGPQNLYSIVWPRAATSAEEFWSGPGDNISAALPCLYEPGYRFRNRRVQTIALRPFACDLTA
ncbi:glycoside hydrolase superfamily [Lactarius pseudohatsudake]|nr:glycoside hydrolase superfamily [Lactarius pseudohatsudake]